MYVNKYETETELLINKQVFINIYILLSRMLARGVILILKNTPQIAQYAKRLLWHWIFWMCFSTFVEWKSIKTFLTMEWSITFQNPIKWHNNLFECIVSNWYIEYWMWFYESSMVVTIFRLYWSLLQEELIDNLRYNKIPKLKRKPLWGFLY